MADPKLARKAERLARKWAKRANGTEKLWRLYVSAAVHELTITRSKAGSEMENAARDPHHFGAITWKWSNGKLYQRSDGQAKWSLVKRVRVTPARIKLLASILAEENHDG